jgi:hypothetical protein
MDLSSLETLGKVAGLSGNAIGVVALLVRPLIDRVSSLPAAQRAPLLRLVATGAFGIGPLGIVAWLVSGMQGGNVLAASGGVAAGRDITGTVSTRRGGSASQPSPAGKSQ